MNLSINFQQPIMQDQRRI